MQVRPVNSEEIQAYRRDGAVYLPKFLDAASIEPLRRACESEIDQPGQYSNELARQGRFFEARYMFWRQPAMREYIFDTGIAESAGRAMGCEEVRVYFDHLFLCDPNTPLDYYWHQDISYWPIGGDQVCSFWLTLEDCTPQSSALQVVLGSDKGPIYSIRAFGDENFGEDVQAMYDHSIPKFHEHRDEYRILAPDMKAGDAILFNSRVMHSSAGNRSPDTRRVAYSVRFIGEDVVWQPKPGFDHESVTPESHPKPGERFSSGKFPVLWRGRPAA